MNNPHEIKVMCIFSRMLCPVNSGKAMEFIKILAGSHVEFSQGCEATNIKSCKRCETDSHSTAT